MSSDLTLLSLDQAVHRTQERRLVGSGPGQPGGEAAAVQREHAIAYERKLGELAREEHDRAALVGEPSQKRVDLPLRPDVDAAGRVEAEHRAKPTCKPARDRHLLLVAPGEAPSLAPGAHVDLQRVDRTADAPAFVAHVDRTPATDAVVARRGDVLAHRPLR